MNLDTSIECVLFDLDGTLIDTAPDFFKAVNALTDEEGRSGITRTAIDQTVSDGARALVKLAFSISENDTDFDRLNQRLLDLYHAQLMRTESVLYPGLEILLEELAAAKIPWGIVTNKPEKYSLSLLQQMDLLERCGVLVCPDHVTDRKPHPEPIVKAMHDLNVSAERTVYLGDHIRDIQAAKSADVIAIAASYGYLPADAKVEEWCADFILRESDQLIPLLNMLKFA